MTGDGTSSNEHSDDDDELSSGAIAGIVIGIIVGLIIATLLIAVVLYFIKGRQGNTRNYSSTE